MSSFLQRGATVSRSPTDSFTLDTAGTTEGDTGAFYIDCEGVLRRGSKIFCDFTTGTAVGASLDIEESADGGASGVWIAAKIINAANGGAGAVGAQTADGAVVLASPPKWLRLSLSAVTSGSVKVTIIP